MWDSSDDEELSDTLNVTNNSTLPFIRFIVIFLLSWQSIFRMPNSALNVLLKFISVVLLKLRDITKSNFLTEVADIFPNSLQKAQCFESINRDDFRKLIVCPSCHTTYENDDCFSGHNAPLLYCSYVRYPRHPQVRMRAPCNTRLLKEIRTSSGRAVFRPIKIFCFQSIIDHLRNIVTRPGIFDLFSEWK